MYEAVLTVLLFSVFILGFGGATIFVLLQPSSPRRTFHMAVISIAFLLVASAVVVQYLT